MVLFTKTYMRIYTRLFCLIALLGLTGCAGLKSNMEAYDSCTADPACMEKMRVVTESSVGIATVVSSALASPLSVPIAGLISLLVSLLTGIYLGKKKKAA